MKKKNNIVEWAITNHRVVILIVCCLIAFGVYSLDKMNKNEFPDFTIRQGIVVAIYPGASVSEIEEQVTKPLEDYIFSYKEVCKEKTKSMSRHDASIIQIELNPDLDDKDVFWSKFKHGLNTFKASLPAGVMAVEVNDDFGDTSALLLTIESDQRTYKELSDIVDALQDHLRTIEAVGRMQVYGMEKEQISIYLDNARLAHYGISFETLATTLYAKGFNTMAGTLRHGDYNSPIKVAQAINIEADVENIIVYSSPSGEVVRLGDIADVRREYAPFTSMITNNSVKSLLLSVEMKQGRNITEMGSDINTLLDTFANTLPHDVKINKITDQPKVVADSVAEFLKELLIAIVAVMIVVLLLLPLRVATIASATIPITIFIALGLFYALDIELNTVTLAALIMTLGMIVDNSIVIIDAYMENLANGTNRLQAAVTSATHFFQSILIATLAISITFFPLLLTMQGTFRDFLQAFPFAITIVLAVSLVVAEMVVPFLLYFFIRQPETTTNNPTKKNRRGAFDKWLQEKYNKLVDSCFHHPRTTLTIGVALVALSIFLVKFVPLRLMPTADRDQFAVEIYLPTGSAYESTVKIADSLENILREDPRVLSIASFKGMSSPRFQMGYAPQIAGENYAQFIVNTTSINATEELLDKYSQLNDAFPQAYVRFKQLAYGVEENPIEIRIAGFDYPQMKHVADTILSLMRQNTNIWLARSDINEPLPTTAVTLNETTASRLAITNAILSLTLASRYNSSGLPIATLWDGNYDYPVVLKSTNADAATITTLNEELIPVLAGISTVPLRAVATVTQDYEEGQLSHRNGIKTITLKADTRRGKNTTAVTNDLMQQLKTLDIPSDITITAGGEVEQNGENLPRIISALAISVVIIFFLLLAHYKSIAIPLLLLVSLSLTLFGTVISVFIAQIDFGVTSFLGIISLMGILVRNTIIMYDYANELIRDEQLDVKTAILTSAKRRMHPIFLTSMAASMGVIPMILGGSGLWQPMGVIICYGTLITMVLILTILPIAYWKLNNISSHETK